jgi:PAS domain S-box-containing protein
VMMPAEAADAYEEEVRWAREPERSLVPVRIEHNSGDALARTLHDGVAHFSADHAGSETPAGNELTILEMVGAREAIAVPFAPGGDRSGALLLTRSTQMEAWQEVDRRSVAQLGALFDTLLGWLRAETRYSRVVGTIEDCLFSFSPAPDGRRSYSLITSQIEALTGYPADAFLAGTISWQDEIVHPDDRLAVAAYERSLREGYDGALMYRILHRSGAVRWLREGASPGRDAGGRRVMAGILSDVTDQKEIEASLLQAKQDAEIANRLKSSFLATMSHELRTPLGAIKGFAELLAEEVAAMDRPHPEVLEFAEVIGTNADRVLRLIGNLFDLAKLQTDRLPLVVGAVAVQPIIAQVADRYRARLAEKGIDLQVEDCPGEPVVQADATRLDQVLDIVMSNANKFTETGRVTISTTVHAAIVSIRTLDTGIGIHEEYLAQLFEPFIQEDNRLNRSYEGSGLGLALAQRLVHAMQGEISLSSERGAGTLVEIVLPRADV